MQGFSWYTVYVSSVKQFIGTGWFDHGDYLMEKYKNCVITPVTVGGTNELFTVSRDSETRLVKVTGISSEDIVNEYNALQLLSEANETPKVYDFFYI